MAKRFTPSGIKSVEDPFEKKKKKEEPAPAPAPAPAPEPVKPVVQVIRDQDTGRISGVIKPDGSAFLGSGKDIKPLIEKETGRLAAPAGSVEAGSVLEPQDIEAAKTELEAGGFLDKITPPTEPEDFLKTGMAKRGMARGEEMKQLGFSEEEIAKRIKVDLETFENLPAATVRDKALKEIRKRAREKGIKSFGEFSGVILENLGISSLSFLGIDVGKFVDNFTNTPTSIVENIVSQFEKVDDTISTTKEAVSSGDMEPELAMSLIDNLLDDIAVGKGRIDHAVSVSLSLRSEPEKLDRIALVLLKAEQKLITAREDISQEKLRRLTGTGTAIPTDEQLYNKLIYS